MILRLPVVSLLNQAESEIANVCKLEGDVIYLGSIDDVTDAINHYPTVVWEVPDRRYISTIGRLRKGHYDYVKIGDDVVVFNRFRWIESCAPDRRGR